MKKQYGQSHPMTDPALKSLLHRMEPHIAQSFTVEQLLALRRVVGLRGGRLHSVDARTTVKLPFLPWTFYVVFLAGQNKRMLSESEKTIAVGMLLLVITCLLMMLTIFGILIIYLLKSWIGINVFEDFSLGLLSWLNSRL